MSYFDIQKKKENNFTFLHVRRTAVVAEREFEKVIYVEHLINGNEAICGIFSFFANIINHSFSFTLKLNSHNNFFSSRRTINETMVIFYSFSAEKEMSEMLL